MPNTNKKVVVVLGMHRSGTSALTGLLHNAGLYVGDDLIDPIDGVNDKGFWESKSILDINTKILGNESLDWDSIFDSTELISDKNSKYNYEKEITLLIKSKFDAHKVWGFKDPRTCRLLPLWLNAFKENRLQPVFIIIYRHPLEVANSLHKRDKLDKQHSVILWLLHNFDAEYNTHSLQRIFINYSYLVSHSKDEVNRIARFLSKNDIQLNFSNDYSENTNLDPSLKHNTINSLNSDKDDYIYNHAIQHYLHLDKSKSLDIKKLDNLLDRDRTEFLSKFYIFSKLFKYESSSKYFLKDNFINSRNIIKSYESNVKKLNEVLDSTYKCYEKTNDLISIKDEQLQQSSDYIDSLKMHIHEYETAYSELQDSIRTKDEEINKNKRYNEELYEYYIELEAYSKKNVEELTFRYKQINEQNLSIQTYSNEYSKLQFSLQQTTDAFELMEKQLEETISYNNQLTTTHKAVETAYKKTINTLKIRDEDLKKYQQYTNQLTKAYDDAQYAYKTTIEYLNAKDKEIEKTLKLLEEKNTKLKNLEHIEKALRKNSIKSKSNRNNKSDDILNKNISTNEYETKLDIGVVNNSHSKMFRLLEEEGTKASYRILEIGCSTAYFGELLKTYGHEVWGIEIDPKAAEIAKLRIDEVFTGTIEEFLRDPDLIKLEFDYILLGDVIEHVLNPLKVLKDCQKILSDNGKFIISVPNVAHITVRSMLLEGRWDYSECGILDKTHLHFFTRDSLIRLMSDAGLSIEVMDTTIVSGNDKENKDIPDVAEHIYTKTKNLCSDFEQDTLQYIIKSKPSFKSSEIEHNKRFSTTSGPNILCLLPIADWSIGNIRIRDPLTKYRTLYGGNFKIMATDGWKPEDISWADTIIFQREVWPPLLALISHFQKLGKKIILDIDDLLTDVPSFLISHESCKQSKPYLEEGLRMVDSVSVTTDVLKNQLKKYTKHIYVIPNCVNTIHPKSSHFSSETEPVNLIIASYDSVRVDFIFSTLKRLLNNNDVNINIIGIGPPGKAIEEQGIPIQWYPNVAYDHWKAFIAEQHNTIGIIPLDDSTFSSCKSAIKYFDYALAGIPSVCSNLLPYSPVIENGVTGILSDNNENSWYESILKLVESAKLRNNMAINARQYVQDYFSLNNSAHAWNEMLKDTQAGRGQQGTILTDLPTSKKISNFAKLCVKPRKYKEAIDVLVKEGPAVVKQRISKHF